MSDKPNIPSDEDRQKAEHQARMMAAVAETLNSLALNFPALLVAQMTSGFLARLLNALLQSRKLTSDDAANIFGHMADATFGSPEDAPQILLPEHISSGRLH